MPFIPPQPDTLRPIAPRPEPTGAMPPGLVAVRGLDLRHAVLVVLDHRFGLPRTVTELLDDLSTMGLTPASAHPGKYLADAMRWEIRRGRVERVGWGRYRLGHLPESTRWRARRRVRELRAPAR